jgi:hypothetical protein
MTRCLDAPHGRFALLSMQQFAELTDVLARGSHAC